MSNREQQIKFILKYAPHTKIGKIKGGITRERLNTLSNSKLSTLYRKSRNIVQEEIFDKKIKIPDRESWRDDYDFLKKASKDLLPILKKIGGRDPGNDKLYNRFKNSTDRTEAEDEMLYNWSKKYSEKLKERLKDGEIDNIPNEVFFPLMKEYEMRDMGVINDIIRMREVIEYQVEQNVSEKVGKKLEAKLGQDITNKIAEYFDGRGVEPGYPGFEKIEYDKHGKRRKYRSKMQYGEKRFEPTYEPDSDDEEYERRIKLRDDRTKAGIAGIQARGKGKVSSDLIGLMGEFIGSNASGWNMDMAKSLAKQNKLKNVEDNKDMSSKRLRPRGPPPPPKYYKPTKTQSLSAIDMPKKMDKVKRSDTAPPILSSRIQNTLDRFSEAIKEDEEDYFKPDWEDYEEEEKTFVPREGLVEVEQQPNVSIEIPELEREDTIPMETPPLPRNVMVKKARKQRNRDILSWALTDNGKQLWENKYGNMKQTKWTNKMVKDFMLGLNNDEKEMAFKKQYGSIENIKEALQITEAQKKVQPQLGNLVATKTEQINIGVEKREHQLGVSGTTNVDIEKEEIDLGISDIKQINIQPSFGVNKKVAQKSISTQLGLKDVGLSDSQIEQVEQMGDLSELVSQGDSDINHNLIRNTFGDNMIRDVNAGLTGLEINPSIPIRRGLGQPLVRNIVRSQLGVRGRIIEDESKLQQVEMLNGNDDELPHAQAVVGNIDDEELIESQKLAGNNMYSEDQQLFLGRERANKTMERRKEPLDKELGDYEREEKEEREEKYDNNEDIEPDQQGVDYGDIEPVEGRDNMNQIQQQYLENRNIRGKGTWTGNRGVGYDFTRQAIVDRESNHLRNAQSLNFLRGESIPYNMPTRNYATNQVGLIRNSNRSMILEVNALEP